MNWREAAFLVQLARVNRATAEINSGAYKLSKMQRGVNGSAYDGNGNWVGIEWRDLTDEEKLRDKVDELNRHIHILEDLKNALYRDQLLKDQDGSNTGYYQGDPMENS